MRILVLILLFYSACGLSGTWKGQLQIAVLNTPNTIAEIYSLLSYQLKAEDNSIYDLNLPISIDANTLLLETPAIVNGEEVSIDNFPVGRKAITVSSITFMPPYTVKMPLNETLLLTIQVIPTPKT